MLAVVQHAAKSDIWRGSTCDGSWPGGVGGAAAVAYGLCRILKVTGLT